MTMRKDFALQGVVFDMDGLLLDSEQVYFKAYHAAEAALGLPRDDGFFHGLIGLDSRKANTAMEVKFGARAQAFDAEWTRHIKAAFLHPVPLKPGVREVTGALQKAGVPYAIATSTGTDTARRRLDLAGLGDAFDLIIGGDQVQNGKPAPDIYLEAARRLGLPPTSCAAFEDSQNGTRAALAAGMWCFQVPDLVDPSPEFRAMGQTVVPDLMAGARVLGLIRS